MEPGIYFIVSVYKAEGFCIDMPHAYESDAEGRVAKFWPNASQNQKWLFERDPDRTNAWFIRWAFSGKYLYEMEADHEIGQPTVHFGPQKRDGSDSWILTQRGPNNSWTIGCYNSGRVMDYWSDDDEPGRAIRTKAFIEPGVNKQQFWYLQGTV